MVRGRQEDCRKQAGFSNAPHAYWRAKMARRSRKSRSDAVGQITTPASPSIKRPLPFFDILDEEKIEALVRQVDWLIEDVGVAFRDDPFTLDLWRAEGAKLRVTLSVLRPTGSVRSVRMRRTSSRRSRAILKDQSRSEGTIRSLHQSMAHPLSEISKAGGVTVISRHSTILSV